MAFPLTQPNPRTTLNPSPPNPTLKQYFPPYWWYAILNVDEKFTASVSTFTPVDEDGDGK